MNKKWPLVSVITPCYNGERWVGRLIESVLNQTYPSIEFIIVNDGSTDKSEEVILSYQNAFENKGYKFKYIPQKNMGLGGAINTGLKEITGEYFCWPDADDYLELNSIEVRASFLMDHPEYAIVTSDAFVRNADDLLSSKRLVKKGSTEHLEENQFPILLDGKGIFCSGCHMVRTSDFDVVNPTRDIYPARRGQNWQLLLPIYYRFKRFYLDEPLYNYIDNPGSMSKDLPTIDSILVRSNEHEDIILHTLRMIEDVQKVNLEKEKDEIRLKYINQKLMAAKDYHDIELYKAEYLKKKKYGVTVRETLEYYRFKFSFIDKIIMKLR